MHPKLIKANIAMYNGARSETRRLLEEYRAEEKDVKPTPMMLWLDAQSQDTRDARIERLHVLLEEAGEKSRYATYAKEYIDDERKYSDKPLPGAKRRFEVGGVPIGKALLFLIVGGAAGFIIFTIFNPGIQTSPRTVPTPIAFAGTPGDATLGAGGGTPLSFPNAATPVAPESHQAEYARGILQISSVEANSQRAADIQQRAVLTPVTGARFYALKLIFECREGICLTPPQASLSVQLEGGGEISAMPNVGIANENLFQPVAQGRSTNGWVVFQIPLDSVPTRLIITPESTQASETPTPVFIDLTGL